MSAPEKGEARFASGPGFFEFVALIALMMALGAFSIDNLLPAFGPIHDHFQVPNANDLQLIMTVYMTGFALMQLFYGPVADAIGRRPTFLIAIVIYLAGSVIALFAASFTLLLVARAVQGMGAAAARVIPVAIVRDRFEGREMARVMSLTMMIFIIVPIISPSIGSLILLVSGWRAIFGAMATMALVIAVWFSLRMPETLHPEYRQSLSPARMLQSFRRAATTRVSIGYATCMGLMIGCLMTYINSAQQIFETDVFALGPWFPLAFASIAAAMGVASFTNSRLVTRFGMRRMSHGGAIGFVIIAAIQLAIALAYSGKPPLILFAATLAGCHFLFSLIAPNFNAMAMEPLADIAGTASSFLGSYTTLLGALIGFIVGQSFNGTVIPLAIGYLVAPSLCVIVALWTERGKLFQPHPSRVGR